MILEDLQTYEDEAGVTLAHDHMDPESGVAVGYWTEGDATVGKLLLALDGDSLEVRFISLGRAAGQGILGRYILWLLTKAKQAGLKTVWADALDAAATVAEYHGSVHGDGFRWTCDLTTWEKPSAPTEHEWRSENPGMTGVVEQIEATEEAETAETP